MEEKRQFDFNDATVLTFAIKYVGSFTAFFILVSTALVEKPILYKFFFVAITSFVWSGNII